MATPVIMPRQGQSVESCIIAKWHKKKGDQVNVGDLLFSYETDKAAFDEEATVAGTLLDVFFEEGDDVECLLNVCVIGEPGEDTSQFRPDGAGESAPAEANTRPPHRTKKQRKNLHRLPLPLWQQYLRLKFPIRQMKMFSFRPVQKIMRTSWVWIIALQKVQAPKAELLSVMLKR